MGLVVCGRCGQRLMVQYGGRASRLRYTCGRAAVEYAAPVCQGPAGRVVDALVAEPVRQFTAEMPRRLLGERGSGPATGEGPQAG